MPFYSHNASAMFHCVKSDEIERTTSILWFNNSFNCSGPFYQVNYQSRPGICRSDDDNDYYYSGELTSAEDDSSRMTCTTSSEPWKANPDAAVYL